MEVFKLLQISWIFLSRAQGGWACKVHPAKKVDSLFELILSHYREFDIS